jgi:di/tricarboxylate transporter
MGNVIAIISLLCILAVIVISFTSKVNLGVLAICAAVIIGRIGGLTDVKIYSSINLNVFFVIAGIFFFNTIILKNGTMELLGKKLLKRLKFKNPKFFPIVAFVFCFMFCLIDVSGFIGNTIWPFIFMSMAVTIGANPLLTGFMCIFGNQAAFMTPIPSIHPTCAGIAAASGFTGMDTGMMFNMFIVMLICAVAVYLVYGGYKAKGLTTGDVTLNEELPHFNRAQIISLFGLLALILSVLIFNLNSGLAAFVIGSILLLLKCADSKDTLTDMPWDTIVIIFGGGMLMTVCMDLGGVHIMANLFASISSHVTAAPILSFTSAFMSWFSFAIAVPIPSLIPTIHTIMKALGTSSPKPVEMVSAVINGGFIGALSPLSMCGGVVLAAYCEIMKPDKKERVKVFNKILFTAIGVTVLAAIVAGTGIYGIFK